MSRKKSRKVVKSGRKRGRGKRVRKRKDKKKGWRDISVNDILSLLAGNKRIKKMLYGFKQLTKAFRRKWARWHLQLEILFLFFLVIFLSIFLGTRLNSPVDKYLPVRVSLTGELPLGYGVAEVTSLPPGFFVCGPKRKMEALSRIPTEPVDVTGIRESNIRMAKLDLRERGCKIIKPVPVLVGIKLVQKKKLTDVPVRVIHPQLSLLQPYLKKQEVTLVIKGQAELVRSLGPGDIMVTLDARNLAYGTYLLSPEISLPPGVELVSIVPPTFEVILGSKMIF